MKTPLLVTVLFVVLLSFSCEYQPTGTNFHQVDSRYSHPDAYLNLPLNKDTIYYYAYEYAGINYKLEGELDKFFKVIFTVDSAKKYEFNTPIGSLKIIYDTNKVITIKKLTINALFHSGTNSLADKLGGEGNVLTKNWVLVIYNRNKYLPLDLKYENINGRMRISWEKYKSEDFGKLSLTKTVINDSYNYFTLAYITDPNITEFYDDSFVGERAKYSLILESISSNLYLYCKESEPSSTINPPLVEYIDRNNIRIKWNKCQYYNNFACYKFSVNSNSSSSNSVNQDIDDINVTRYDLNEMVHGGGYVISCYPVPKNKSYTGNIGKTTSYIHGEPSFKYDFANSTSAPAIYYSLANEKAKTVTIYKYNTNLKKTSDSIVITVSNIYLNFFSASPSGNYLLVNNQNYIELYRNGLMQYPERFTTQQLFGSSSGSLGRFKIIDNGIAFFNYFGKFWIYDLINKKLIDTIPKKDITDFQVSSNIKNFALYSIYGYIEVYGFNQQNKIVQIITKTKAYHSFFFDRNQNNILWYYNNEMKKLIEYDCLNQTEIKSISLNTPYDLVDAENLIFKSNDFKVAFFRFDGNSFNQTDQFYCASDSQYGFFKDGYFYSRPGVKCKVSY